MTAIAGRAGVPVSLKRLNELSDTTPVLVNLKPVGNGYMEDFFAAGGIGALLRELKDLLHLDAMTVTGETLGERLEHDSGAYVDRSIIAERAKPLEPQGGLVALFVILAPGRDPQALAAERQSARDRGQGGGVCLAGGSCRPHRRSRSDVSPRIFWCCKTPARIRPRRCRGRYLLDPEEAGDHGVKDMVRVSDARIERHRLRYHRAACDAGTPPRRPARSGQEWRHRIRPVGEKPQPRSPGRRAGNSSAARSPEPAARNRHAVRRALRPEILAPPGCDFDFLRPADGSRTRN